MLKETRSRGRGESRNWIMDLNSTLEQASDIIVSGGYNCNSSSSGSCRRSLIATNTTRRPKDLRETKRMRITEALLVAGGSPSSSPSSPLYRMTTIEAQDQGSTSRNRLERLCCGEPGPALVATRSSRRRPRLHLSAPWATLLLALILAVLLGERWLGTEAIKLQPDGVEKFYWTGEKFVITCQNNNNIKNAKIRWYGPDRAEIFEDHSKRVYTETSGNHGHRLVVHDATAPQDEGRYKCTVAMRDEPRVARESIEFQLKLYRETSFAGTNDSVVLIAGQPGSLKCHVQFDPSVSTPSVTWARGTGADQKRVELLNDRSYQVRDYDPHEQVSELILSQVRKTHDDWYTCSASAITDKLSNIKDHPIRLETNYPPHFDTPSHTVWIERASLEASAAGMGGRVNGGGGQSSLRPSAGNRRQQQQHYPQPSGVRARPSMGGDELASGRGANNNNLSSTEHQMVSVELRCSVEANPEASIVWSSSGADFALAKGSPAHIADERTERLGHNITSILVIDYNLAPNWPHKQDTYTCSASNKLGSGSKRYNIEQSDPPPAFQVGQHKSYNPQTKLYEFTLLGPQQQRDEMQGGRQREIVPPVDSFRIRASSPNSDSTTRGRQLNEPSVQVSLAGDHHHQPAADSSRHNRLSFPQNFTVNLSRLPSGQQRLYLEAHNAVGWSPNATYLGDYYLVSGASSRLAGGLNPLGLILASLMTSLLISVSARCHSLATFILIP